MSEFGVLDCIIRDPGGISNVFGDEPDFQGELPISWDNGGSFDVLSASMQDSGILPPSTGLSGNNNDTMMLEAENDDLLKSMLTGMDGTSMETFESSLGVEEQEIGVGYNSQLNLDEFNLELLSPISSSSDGSNTISEDGTQNQMLGTPDVLTVNVDNSELDLLDYLSNDDSDVTLPAVDPRTISPASSNELTPEEDGFEELNQYDIKTENNTSNNVSHFNIATGISTKGEKKFLIKARRNIKPKNLESDNTQTAITEWPMTATSTFLHQVKQSPSTINLLSHTGQRIKVMPGTKNISIAKTPITVAPSINTGTTTILLPVFNTKQQTQKHLNGPSYKTSTGPTIVVTENNLVDQQDHGGHKRRRISASSSDSGLDDAASTTSSGSGTTGESQQYSNSPNIVTVHPNQQSRRGPAFTTNNKYPRLDLSEEEKRLCENDNINLPTHYPLTKEEERNLKKIRRKIRNKVSAQDSRKRKKDYVESMESRAMRCAVENSDLQKKIALLETQNRTLVGQLRRLHQIIVNRGGISSSHPVVQAVMGNNRGAGSSGGQTSTALMVLLLSAALFLIPGMREQYESKPPLDISQALKGPPLPGQSRSLLHFTNTHNNNIKDEFTQATNNNVNNKNDVNLKNIKVESASDDASTNVADIAAINAGMPHKTSSKYGASSPGPFGDHDYYYAFSDDDDGAPSIKREPWSPSMSPNQKSYIDADVPPLGYGEQKIMMEEQMQKTANIDFSFDDHLTHTNMSSENDQFSVEKEVIVTTAKEDMITNSNDYNSNNRNEDMEMADINKLKFGGERRLNVSVSVGGGIGKGGGMRTVVLHVPKDIQ